MKKLLIIMLCLLTPVALFGGLTETFRYKNLLLEVPEGWRVEEGEPPVLLILLSPLEAGDTFLENIVILEEPLVKEYTPYEYMLSGIEGFSEITSDFSIEYLANSSYNLTWGLEGMILEQFQRYYVHGQTGYVLTGSSDPENYQRYHNIFVSVANSFRYDLPVAP